MKQYLLEGVYVYGVPSDSWSEGECEILKIKYKSRFSLRKSLWDTTSPTVSPLTILIFHKLGIDLSNKEVLSESLKSENRNRVILVWNNLIKEFKNIDLIFEKLKEKDFNINEFDTFSNVENPNYLENSNENKLIFIGNTKQMELCEENIKIGPTGNIWGKMKAASGTTIVDIYYSDIRSVVVQQPNIAGALFSGGNLNNIANSLPYIRILLKGTESYSNGNFRPSEDPYTLTFTADKKGEAENFKLQIDKLVSKHRQNTGGTISNQISSADELEKFANLLEKNIITKDEFDLKKKQILGL